MRAGKTKFAKALEMKPNVLVTAAGSGIAQGIMRAINISSLGCNIIACDTQPYAAGLYRAKSGYLVPLAKEPGFIDRIIEISKAEKIDAICIGTDYELLQFAENRDRIEKESGAKTIVSSPGVIKTANDKWLTNQFLEKNGLPSIPSSLENGAMDLADKEGFPLIVKPRIGDSSKNTFVVKSREGLEEKLALLLDSEKNPYLDAKAEPMVQKYVGKEQEEYTSTTVVFGNKAYGVISMQREMKFPGHTTKAIIDDYPEIRPVVKKAAEALGAFGPCNFQSRFFNGKPYIFEINSRFSGTTATCAMAGFNTVEACLRKVVLGEELKDLTYKKGVMLKYLNEMMIPAEEIDRIAREKFLKQPKSEVNENF